MSHLKKFENFINEELSPSTYANAASKLKKKGHNDRAHELERYSKSKIEPAEVTLGDKKFIVLPENIQFWNQNESIISIWITIDRYLIQNGDPNDPDDYDEDGIEISFTKNGDKWDVESNGVILQDRSSARSVYKLVNQWVQTTGNEVIMNNINKLTINDLYE